MNIMHNLKHLLLFGGLSKDQYRLVRNEAVKANHDSLRVYAPIACIAFCALLIISHVAGGVANANQSVYVGSCIAMGAITFGAHACKSTSSRLVSILVHSFMVVLYTFSLCLSITNAQSPGVSSIVFLMLTPLLFAESPLDIMMGTIFTVAINCLASSWYKTPQIAATDTRNLVAYGIVAMVVVVFVMRIKFQALLQSHEIAYLSTHDALTGLRNRNSYENKLDHYASAQNGPLVCAYADANGLHQLNNSKGHEAGDEMLREIARELLQYFEQEHAYRVGGDEFVAFCQGDSVENTAKELDRMRERLLSKGYHVSFGVSQVSKRPEGARGIRALVRDAEKEMYLQKSAYYELAGAR